MTPGDSDRRATGPTDARRAPEKKVLELDEAVRRFGPPREFRLVFTNGCFDLLHRGHAAYLNAASALGDLLLVGLNSDDSVRRLKGPGRPVLPVADRAYLLASLGAVDAVVVFDEDTPLRLVEALVPDVLAKGADYRPEEVVGREVVEEAGGDLILLELEEGRSTSDLLDRIRGGMEEGAESGDSGADGPGTPRGSSGAGPRHPGADDGEEGRRR